MKLKYKEITYSDNIYKNLDAGLYVYDDIAFIESKEIILANFKHRFEIEIRNKLNNIGLQLISFNYHSPKYYNYDNDSIDTIIKVKDIKKLKDAIISNKDKLNKALSKNKSYDGYIPLTQNNVSAELKDINDWLNGKNAYYEPDIIILRELLNIDCKDFDVVEFFVYEWRGNWICQ